MNRTVIAKGRLDDEGYMAGEDLLKDKEQLIGRGHMASEGATA
ncbi:hypothetical protein [Hahella sp. CCB-MM4]|nr:hypothetical protein [Hahella sp. CCB-MM4]